MVACYLLGPWLSQAVRHRAEVKGTLFQAPLPPLALPWSGFSSHLFLKQKPPVREEGGLGILSGPAISFLISFLCSNLVLILHLQPWLWDKASFAMIFPVAEQGEGKNCVIAHLWWIWMTLIRHPYVPTCLSSKSVLADECCGLQVLICYWGG